MKSPSAHKNLRDDAPAGAGRLVFWWRDEPLPGLRLAVFLLVSLLAHAFCFYLFQVVYPPSQRFTPRPARITLLSPADSRGRVLLRSIEDRVVYSDTGSRESSSELRIEDYAVSFEPSFSRYALVMRDLPPAKSAAGRADPVQFEAPELPEPQAAPGAPAPGAAADAVAVAVAAGAAQGTPRIIPRDGLQGRAIRQPGDWNWTRDHAAALEGQRILAMVAVAPKGSLQHILIHRGIDSALDEEIIASLREVRFEERPEGDPKAAAEWGAIELQW